MAAITLRRVACESARARFASSLALRTTFSHISDESCVDRAIQNLEEHLSRGRDYDDSVAKWKFAGFRSPRRPLGPERAWTASGSTASACVGLVQSRSFAAKAKKPKSKAEDTVEVADVSDTAKESALKMMDTALDVLARELSKLRTGRVSPGMLDHITVEAHGVRTPLSHIAAVSVAGLQTLNVLPYDPSMLKEVEKALLMSPLGLNPLVEGSTLTVPLPRLTKEHCESMCKLAAKAGENAKLSIRRARKEALDQAKAAGLSKDDTKRFEKEIEELTKKSVKAIDDLCKKKEKDIRA